MKFCVLVLLLLFYAPLPCVAQSIDNDNVQTDVKFSLKQSRPGYVFQISCSLDPEISYKRIPQHYYFLLDRSNSISRTRFFHNKKAIYAALSMLQPDDTFNIITFGGHTTQLATKNVPWDKENITRARAFLENQNHGGLFASTGLYSLLARISKLALKTEEDKELAENELHTALLFSDGDIYLSQAKQQTMIGSWSKDNQGKIALFSIASGNRNNLPLLELLSNFNKGALVYAQKHEQIVERTQELLRSIQNPIGKNLKVEALVEEGNKIILQPKDCRLSHLYQNRPIMIYGSTSNLAHFTLKLEGYAYGRPFVITKEISLKEAGSGSYSIERKWVQLAVQDIYESFFEDGNQKHLEVAKQLLTPLNLPILFLDQNR